MATSTPRLTACAAAVTTGLLALVITPSLSSASAVAPLDRPVATPMAGPAAKAPAATRTAKAPASTRPGYALLGDRSVAAPSTGTSGSAALRMRSAGSTSDESTVRLTGGSTSTTDAKATLQKSLDAARRGRIKPAPTTSPTPTASPAPSPTATTSPSPSPTATQTTAPSPSPSVTTSPTASPTPTASTSPSPSPTVTVSPTSSPTPTPTSTAFSPSGVNAPVGDMAGWKQVYSEDFKTSVPTGSFPGPSYPNWGVYSDGWKDTSKNGTYMPSKVLSVHDGVMDYHVRTENGLRMVSAPWLKSTKGQTYGRYSVRFRSESLPGYKTAWLLWPDSERWPDDGEIDFPEGNLGAGDNKINAFHHYASATGGQDWFGSNATYADWHTATIEWTPGKVVFMLDGVLLGSSTKNVPATAMHWVLQTETNLDGYVPSSTVAGHVFVDWVAIWTRA